jgi:hypothetical protein
LLLLTAFALGAAALGDPDWREFDRRQRGWGETPSEYDAARIERRGARIRVWIRYEFMLSGLPDIRTTRRVEIDCARRRSADMAVVISGGTYGDSGGGPYRRRFYRRLTPVAAGSVEEALARAVCPAG